MGGEPGDMTPIAAGAAPPAADELLATVIRRTRGSVEVRLPSAVAKAAVEKLFEWYRVAPIDVVTEERELVDVDAPPGSWLVVVPAAHPGVGQIFPAALLREAPVVISADGSYARGIVLPRDHLVVGPRIVSTVKHATAAVAPLDESGLPKPWVPVKERWQALADRGDDHDVVLGPLPEIEPYAESDVESQADSGESIGLSDEAVRELYARLLAQLGWQEIPLRIQRTAKVNHGFVTGRIHFTHARGEATAIAVTLCPNADRAEVAATLTHELAHAVAKGSGHGRAFKEALVGLAEAVWGRAYLAGARGALDQRYSLVDGWVATGIRASIRVAEPPTPTDRGEADLAAAVRRIQKLRTLAADQPGTPEAVSATAKANDLVVILGLGTYHVKLPVQQGEQLCDCWILIGRGQRWKARVAFGIAEYCAVFALRQASRGGMHLFGRHADLVTAEYLWAVCTESIERRWAAHLEASRASATKRPRGWVQRERSSFLHSAVDGLLAKLEGARSTAFLREETREIAVQVEEFARAEHDKRGMGWRGGSRQSHSYNAAGYEAGRSLSLANGVGSAAGPAGLIGHRE